MTLRFVVCLALSTGLAFLSRRYFEEPFQRMKNRFEPTGATNIVHSVGD
jgi:peptidoglycan/LPS O-acetylase OafA/YrhL